MNYKKLYFNIIRNRQHCKYNGYTEKHHIIPRCIGGQDVKDNLIDLSAREHYICHWLLYKMYQNNSKLSHKLLSAFMRMHCINEKDQKRYINSRLYEIARIKYSKSCSQKLIGVNNPNYGRVWIYNLKLDENKCINIDDLSAYLKDGWIKGRYIGTVTIYDVKGNKYIIKKKEINNYLNKGYILNKGTKAAHFITMYKPPKYEKLLIDKKFKEYYKNIGYLDFKDFCKYKQSLKCVTHTSCHNKHYNSKESFEAQVTLLMDKIEAMLANCLTLKEACEKYNYSKNVLKEAFRRKTNLPDIRRGLKHKTDKKYKHVCIICGKEFEAFSKHNKYCSVTCLQYGSVNGYIWITNGKINKRVAETDLKNYINKGFYRLQSFTTNKI